MSNYKEYREAVGINNTDMIRALRGSYKRYSGATNAMINNPENYGVCLLPEAEKILAANFGYAKSLTAAKEKPVRKAAIRKRPNRLSVYLSDDMFQQIKKAMEFGGYETVQEFMLAVLNNFLWEVKPE